MHIKTFATILDAIVMILGFLAVITLFTMGGSVGEPGFFDMAVYLALWVFIPAVVAAAAHRIAQRSS